MSGTAVSFCLALGHLQHHHRLFSRVRGRGIKERMRAWLLSYLDFHFTFINLQTDPIARGTNISTSSFTRPFASVTGFAHLKLLCTRTGAVSTVCLRPGRKRVLSVGMNGRPLSRAVLWL